MNETTTERIDRRASEFATIWLSGLDRSQYLTIGAIKILASVAYEFAAEMERAREKHVKTVDL